MTLAHERIGAGPKTLVMLHGIFGRGRNWASIAKGFVALRPEWSVVLADLRLHGASRGFDPPHTLEACARDLDALGPRDAILGHSFGGKVALVAGGPIVWVVDADPSAREPAGESIEMLRWLEKNPRFATRQEAIDAMLAAGFSRAVASWMATNWQDDSQDDSSSGAWIFAPRDLDALLRDYFARDLWDRVDVRTTFVRGTRSPVLGAGAIAEIRARGAAIHEIDAGHWINAEAPDALVRLLASGIAHPQ